MTPEHVTISREGATLVVVLDRPDQRNALTHAMYRGLADALARAEDDPSVIAVIIAANGPGFCAGNDLRDFMENPPADGTSPVGAFLRALSGSSKVLVAAVQGAAVGVGATMLLHCDHVVATEDAKLHFSFVKIGLVPEAASSLLLPRAVGALRAAELLLTGEPVDAFEALALGLVSRIVPAGDQLEAAREFVRRIEAYPPGALRATKRLLRADLHVLEERMRLEGAAVRGQLASPEFAEAAHSFFARKPRTD